MPAVKDRPSFQEVYALAERGKPAAGAEGRKSQRSALTVPIDVITADGTTVPVMIRDLSGTGLGLLHFAPIAPGMVSIHIKAGRFEQKLSIKIAWCRKTENGLFMSGGLFERTPRPDGQTADRTTNENNDPANDAACRA